MKVVPHIFFDAPSITTLFMDGNAAIFYKQVSVPNENNERYVAAHALTLVLSGQLKVEDGEGNMVLVNAGEMVFLPKGIYFVSDFLPDQGTFSALVAFFPDLMLENWANKAIEIPHPVTPNTSLKGDAESPLPLKLPVPDQLKRFTDSILNIYLPAHPENFSLTGAKLTELLHLVAQSEAYRPLKAKVLDLNNRKKRNLVSFMESNFSKPLGVSDFAYLSGRSLSTFQREFKRHFGLSPKKWLIEKRLGKAADLLSRLSSTVGEVALEVGYEDVSHFSKAFRRQYGLSPKQFAMAERQASAM